MKTRRIAVVIGLMVALLVLMAACLTPAPVTVETQANTPCYFALGGTRFVAGRGCTINAQSGSILQADSGAVFTADTITVSHLISSSVGFLANTATITDVTSTRITGTLSTAAQPNVTALGSISNLTATNAYITGTLTISGFQQYPVSYWDMDGVNGAMAAHGLPGAPTYPHCMLYTPVWVTASVYISAANATSVTLAMVDFAGNPYTGDPLAVRCSAVYVP